MSVFDFFKKESKNTFFLRVVTIMLSNLKIFYKKMVEFFSDIFFPKR